MERNVKFIKDGEEISLDLTLYKEGDTLGAYLSDRCGGSGCEAEGTTPESAANQIAKYIADYFYECDDDVD